MVPVEAASNFKHCGSASSCTVFTVHTLLYHNKGNALYSIQSGPVGNCIIKSFVQAEKRLSPNTVDYTAILNATRLNGKQFYNFMVVYVHILVCMDEYALLWLTKQTWLLLDQMLVCTDFISIIICHYCIRW